MDIQTLNKEKLLEALNEEIYVYEPAETKFDEGVLYLAKKLKATISLGAFDDDQQSIISQQKADLDGQRNIYEEYRRYAEERMEYQEAEIEKRDKILGVAGEEIKRLRNMIEFVLFHSPAVDDPLDYEAAYDDLKVQINAEYEKHPWMESSQ